MLYILYYLYYAKYAIAFDLKKGAHILTENTLLLKIANHHWKFQRIAIILLLEGLAWMLVAVSWLEWG